MDRFVRLSDDERRRYFVQAAEQMGLRPQIIEKDFWVCWTLRELFALPDIGSILIFKGGTSLSKTYRLIERFSEDVDVSMDRAGLCFGDENSDPEAVISGKERRCLRLAPHPGRIRRLEEDYDKMREMFFAERPAFAEVLRILEEWETHFNKGAWNHHYSLHR